MNMFWKVILWTALLHLGFVIHLLLFCYFDNQELRSVLLVLLVLWWIITGIIASVKWKEYRKENPAMTKEEKQRLKEIEKERKYRNSAEFKKKYISEVEIENSYFGNGVLVSP